MVKKGNITIGQNCAEKAAKLPVDQIWTETLLCQILKKLKKIRKKWKKWFFSYTLVQLFSGGFSDIYS